MLDAGCVHLLWPAFCREPTIISCSKGGTVSIYQRAAPAEGSPAGWAATHCWQADKNVECMVSAASSRSCTVIVALSPHGPHVGNGASACWPCWSCCTLDLVSQGQRLIAGTAFGKLRTFVTSHKRATREVVSEESRITALAPTADGEQCTGRHRC